MFLIPISPAEWSLSSVAVTDGRFFAASDNGFIYCFAQGEPPADGEDGGDGGEDGGDPQDGGDEEPPALYMRAEAVGPVHFMLTDADGKSAGFNGDGQLMLEIPGSTVTGPDDRVNTAPAATRTDGRLHKAPGTYTRTDGEGEDRPLTVVVVPMDAYDIHLKAYEDGMYDLTLYYYPEGSEPVEFFQGTDVDIAEGEEHIYRAVEGDPDEGGDGSSTEDGEDGETPDGGANGVDGGTDGADGGDGGTGTDGDDDGGVTLEMDRDGDGVPDEEVKLGDTFTGGDIGAPTLPPDGDGGDGGDSGSGKEEDDGDGWLPGLTSALFIAAVISALALFAVRRRR